MGEHRISGFDAAETRGWTVTMKDLEISAGAWSDLDQRAPWLGEQAPKRPIAAE
jgi:hypothetical protein